MVEFQRPGYQKEVNTGVFFHSWSPPARQKQKKQKGGYARELNLASLVTTTRYLPPRITHSSLSRSRSRCTPSLSPPREIGNNYHYSRARPSAEAGKSPAAPHGWPSFSGCFRPLGFRRRAHLSCFALGSADPSLRGTAQCSRTADARLAGKRRRHVHTGVCGGAVRPALLCKQAPRTFLPSHERNGHVPARAPRWRACARVRGRTRAVKSTSRGTSLYRGEHRHEGQPLSGLELMCRALGASPATRACTAPKEGNERRNSPRANITKGRRC